MLELTLLGIYFSYRNSVLAQRKGLNTAVWVIVTIMAFFFAYILAGILILSFFYEGPFQQDLFQKFLFLNPVHIIFIYFAAIGGYLFVRFFLEKMPDKKADSQDETDE